MLTTLYTIFVFCLIISIHEFGHFVVAKLTGMTVHEFSVGMGPRIFHHQGLKTDYSLRLLPIGGYVRLEGEDEASTDKNAFCNKKPWQRFSVLFAGAFMNFLLGFLIFFILFSCGGAITTNKDGNVVSDSAFYDAGILPGDEILGMEGNNYKTKVHSYNDVNFFVSKNGDKPATITFCRDGDIFTKTISPKYNKDYNKKMFGFSPMYAETNFINVITASFRQSIFVIKLVFDSFAGLITGRFAISDMSGPVGIFNEIGTVAKEGMALNFLQSFLNVLSIAALISINLGVVNLLPFPALDGGRILFIILEVIRKKPISKEREGFFHFIGFAFLLLLMVFVTFSDIKRLLGL